MDELKVISLSDKEERSNEIEELINSKKVNEKILTRRWKFKFESESITSTCFRGVLLGFCVILLILLFNKAARSDGEVILPQSDTSEFQVILPQSDTSESPTESPSYPRVILPQSDTSESPRVWDLILMNNEFEVLTARIFELQAVVDFWIVAETEVDFKKNARNLTVGPFLEDFKAKYPIFKDRIFYKLVSAREMQEPCADKNDAVYWDRFCTQSFARNALADNLLEFGAEQEDFCMVSDIDEFPRAHCVTRATEWFGSHSNMNLVVKAFETPNEVFFKGSFKCVHKNENWNKGPKMVTCKDMLQLGPQRIRTSSGCFPRQSGPGVNAYNCDDVKWENMENRIMWNCAWHLSSFGGVERSLQKYQNNVDARVGQGNINSVIKRLAVCEDLKKSRWFDDVYKVGFPDIPKYIADRREEFHHFFDPVEESILDKYDPSVT